MTTNRPVDPALALFSADELIAAYRELVAEIRTTDQAQRLWKAERTPAKTDRFQRRMSLCHALRAVGVDPRTLD
jgi:hypothetical protein